MKGKSLGESSIVYINLFGLLDEFDLKILPDSAVYNVFEPANCFQTEIVNISASIIIIDCIDPLSWLISSVGELKEYELAWKQRLAQWRTDGKIVFVGTSSACKWSIGNKVNLYI